MVDSFDGDKERKHRTQETHNKRRAEPHSIFTWTCFTGLLAAIIFVGFPGIDLWTGKFFLTGNQEFFFNINDTGPLIRNLFKIIFVIAISVALAGLGYSVYSPNQLFGLSFPKWLFVVAALVVGPGLVTNVILKDNWGRARPFHIEQFGGNQKFTPALVRSDQCRRNCSFTCGEASSIYSIFFALALLSVASRRRIIIWGIAAGTIAGVVRMAQGGHFLSDVIFSGIFMMLTVLALHWLIFIRFGDQLKENGWIHSSLALYAIKAERKIRNFARSRGWDKIIQRPDNDPQ